MAINQLSTANTFEQWLIATQSLIAFANSITDGSGGSFTSNTNEYVITGNLTVGNTVTCITTNTDVIIFNDGTRLDSNVQIVAAFNKANAANILAQQAYDYANTISLIGEIVGDNVTVLYTVTGNNIVANTTVTTNTLTANLITATDVNTTSDVSLKDNIEPIVNPLNVLEQITGYSFNWKSDGSKAYGFTAQDLEKILPDIVKTRDDGIKGINYLNLIAFLVEAVKEMKKEINELKNNNK